MSLSDKPGDDAHGEKDEQSEPPEANATLKCPSLIQGNYRIASQPPPAAESQKTECFMKGLEHIYEVLAGVRHGQPRPYRLWDGPSLLATQNICRECSMRLGYSKPGKA
ncbi:hypothetical protein F4777DRAFT_584414 [Nemania sp. FL0916]|nr:hypothetical protein F4777DRAFT_584414 [Nemania sp. FL0916]